jgi:hypothetical protein
LTYDSPFAAIGNTRDTQEVEAKVGAIVHGFAPGHDLSRITRTFGLLDRAFDGELPGYQKLKTLYHNRSHANEVVLCAARMLHGLDLAGEGLDADHIDAALIGALMHDVGYLMTDEEAAAPAPNSPIPMFCAAWTSSGPISSICRPGCWRRRPR